MNTFVELIILLALAIFVIIYRKSNGNENVLKNITNQVGSLYDKYAPYSLK